ncbi:hypothetical protein LX64_05060 [Chitinophaga skermanii]|uniref:Uncharacterized protein n=1 Tax=Chitinophaga skermanii TaxID=331697 RepID=A0A327Q2X7_9BACT|nr:hypothetical protein [Chitinophaga skermanii]RAI97552.1 hypothetical protein LX64_05060 [Chitinophaga skermanii]
MMKLSVQQAQRWKHILLGQLKVPPTALPQQFQLEQVYIFPYTVSEHAGYRELKICLFMNDDEQVYMDYFYVNDPHYLHARVFETGFSELLENYVPTRDFIDPQAAAIEEERVRLYNAQVDRVLRGKGFL